MGSPQKYVLLDGNIIAGYYFPQTLTHKIAIERITTIIDSVRNGDFHRIKLLAPNICIAEAFTVMSKHAYTAWRGKPKKGFQTSIHLKSYKKGRDRFIEDIHKTKLIETVDLHRYHVISRHYISPVDHNTRILKKNASSKPIRELGASDQLIGGMGIWLSRLFGCDRFALLTADYRLAKVLRKGRRITEIQARKWKLYETDEESGIVWSPEIYPNVIDLQNDKAKILRDFFGMWPLITKAAKYKKQKRVTSKYLKKLVELYKAMNIPRDRLPYTDRMDELRAAFCHSTGINFSNAEVWEHLLSQLKKGGGRLRN